MKRKVEIIRIAEAVRMNKVKASRGCLVTATAVAIPKFGIMFAVAANGDLVLANEHQDILATIGVNVTIFPARIAGNKRHVSSVYVDENNCNVILFNDGVMVTTLHNGDGGWFTIDKGGEIVAEATWWLVGVGAEDASRVTGINIPEEGMFIEEEKNA